MKHIYKYIKHTLLFLTVCGAVSCKFEDIKPPTNKIITGTLFQDEGTATAAVLGLYSKLVATNNVFSNGGTTIFAGLSSDELYVANVGLAEYIPFQTNQIAVDNSIISTNFWRSAYEIIYQANSCLQGLQNSTTISDNTKRQLMGECYFIRAFCYWYMVNLFGDTPMPLTPDYGINKQLSRTTSADVKKQILSDLSQARILLTETYPTAGKLRVNYYAVLALLSRYYLYEQNWSETEKLTTEILQSPLYHYETDINKIFLITGTESIWQLQSSQSTFNSVEGSSFIPSTIPSITPLFAVTDNLLASFENNDLRKTAWTAKKTVAGVTYTYPFKYKIRQNTTKTENYVMFRLGEVYLNRAEAYAHLQRPQEALNDLNILRHRANLDDRTLDKTPDILGAVQQERRIELFAEWGHRWFDLRRTGKINQVLAAIKPTWQPTAAWFPIPASEILANPKLTQNDGYNK